MVGERGRRGEGGRGCAKVIHVAVLARGGSGIIAVNFARSKDIASCFVKDLGLALPPKLLPEQSQAFK